MCKVNIRQVVAADLECCHEIEKISYEGDEAATKEKIKRRIQAYPEGFIVLEKAGIVVGFINCGATNKIDLANEDFKDLVGHDSNGRHVVIFSVVVHPKHQGKGLAGKLLVNFITKMKTMNKASIHLICRKRHIGFYEKYGFIYQKESASNHGGLKWHEMIINL